MSVAPPPGADPAPPFAVASGRDGEATPRPGGRHRGSRRDLPDFPWDVLRPAKELAAAHPDGLVDLSIGTPVDPVPAVVQAALCGASNAPGYPTAAGSPDLRAAMTAWVVARCAAAPGFDVLPTIGSKELVGSLPALLGIGPGDTVVIPSICYPTYEVGALLVGANVVRTDSLLRLGPTPRVRLVWINSPANPTGRVLPPEHLRKVVDWARERGAVVASDECYLPLGWESAPGSVLAVCGTDYRSVLAVHSLSKRSNLAGYRAGFVAGDPELVPELLTVRRHAGLMMPAPVQAAMAAALCDEEHVSRQRERYARRREVLADALTKAGLRIEHSEAGLYLWCTRDEECWATVDWFARIGILVAPGSFYGPAGEQFVRVALTAADERVEAAAVRLRD